MELDIISNAEYSLKYTFTNKALIQQALTHPSACINDRVHDSYERLEFLGDALLGAYVASRAFKAFPDCAEGELTRIRIALVCGDNLTNVGRRLGLDKLIIFGRSEIKTGLRGMDKALEDAVEACIAAIYLDGGQMAVHDFIEREIVCEMRLLEAKKNTRQNTGQTISSMSELSTLYNPKSKLQILTQKRKKTPKYTIIKEEGPAHDRMFEAQVSVDGRVLGRGRGKSKKIAQINAAKKALKNYSKEG